MATKAVETKERILSVSERIILQKGFSGTSLDEIIAESDITKGGFFYHFKGKSDLAVSLAQRYLDNDVKFFGNLMERADDLVEDPLQRMLLFLKLLAEAVADLPGLHPGCLVASFTYESQVMDPEVRKLVAEGILIWRRLFSDRLKAVKKKYKPKAVVDVDELAEMLTCVVEGGIISSRALQDPKILVQQILQYRKIIKLLFE